MTDLTRSDYASIYGPTAGDRIRLGDTDLVLEVEADDTAPGSEPAIGFAKTVRDGQLVSGSIAPDDALDIAITNVVVIDAALGIRKTSIGIKDGRITAVGRAGNPDTMDGVVVPLSSSTGDRPRRRPHRDGRARSTAHVHLLGPQVVPGRAHRRHDDARRDGLRRALSTWGSVPATTSTVCSTPGAPRR